MTSKKKKILIVEDEAIIAMVLKNEIAQMGYEILGMVNNGEGAINIVKNNAPNIILMDIGLKGPIDGIQTANIINSKRNIPIIFLSAYSDKEVLKNLQINKKYFYLTKPVQNKDLFETIEKALLNTKQK